MEARMVCLKRPFCYQLCLRNMYIMNHEERNFSFFPKYQCRFLSTHHFLEKCDEMSILESCVT